MSAIRKPRAPMTDTAKAAMTAKRLATIAAKAASGVTPKVRKPRDPMTDEAKAIMAAKRAATLAAKAAAAPAGVEVKARKPRAPMSQEARLAMTAKRLATLAAKKGTWVEPKTRKPREPMTAEAKAAMAAKRLATVTAKKAALIAAKADATADADATAATETDAEPKGMAESAANGTLEPVVDAPHAAAERVSAYNYIASLMDAGTNMKHGVRHLVKDRGLDALKAQGYLVDYMVTEAGQRGFVEAEVRRRNNVAHRTKAE